MDIIAHRGNHDGQKAPENTLKVFKDACNLPIDGIELDIRLSADDCVVVFHDKSTGDLTNNNLNIADSTLEELQKLSVFCQDSKNDVNFNIPILEEVLDQVPANKKI